MVPKSPFDGTTIDPEKMNGQPCIRGLRLTVRRLLLLLTTYPDRSELFREYPELQEEDIRQALAFSVANLDDRVDILEAVGFRTLGPLQRGGRRTVGDNAAPPEGREATARKQPVRFKGGNVIPVGD